MNGTAEKDAIRRDLRALEQALQEAGCDHIHGSVARCPFHVDKHPSASLFRTTDGVWKFRCHKCDITEDVIGVRVRAGSKKAGDVMRDLGILKPKISAVAPKKESVVYPTLDALVASVKQKAGWWAYTHPDTRKVELVVFRQQRPDGGKKFLQARPCEGGFCFEAPPKPWPLANRTRVRAAKEVVVVEGEKCVEALTRLGFVATTSPGGAKNGDKADWTPLSGKRVILWADNDDVGRGYVKTVSDILERLPAPPQLRWVAVSDLELPEGGDVVDYLANYQDGCDDEDRRRVIRMVLDQAESKPATDELSTLLEETYSGKRVAVDLPWSQVSDYTQALIPGTITCVCGDPGCGKSFMLLEVAWHLYANGVRTAVYELEEDRGYHMLRLLAQLSNCSDLTDTKWVFTHQDEVRAIHAEHGEAIREFGKHVWDAPDKPPRLPDLGEWVQERASEGYRVIIVDPVTAAAQEDHQWITDQAFVMCAKSVARRHGCSVILATHPRMGKQGKVLDGLAGGAAYPRFSQTVLWVEKHDKPKRVLVKDVHAIKQSAVINRSVRIGKARNGRGTGWEIGFNLDGRSLRFAQQGIVVDDILE